MAIKQIDKNKKLIVGIGSALIDILAHEDDDFFGKNRCRKRGNEIRRQGVYRTDSVTNISKTRHHARGVGL